jgi:hypothetical protein
MNRTIIWKLVFATMLLLCLAALAPVTNKGAHCDPSLFE